MRKDLNGKTFEFDTLYLEPVEYYKIVHEINTHYSKYKDKAYAIHRSLDLKGRYCLYFFENRGYDDYNIVGKSID